MATEWVRWTVVADILREAGCGGGRANVSRLGIAGTIRRIENTVSADSRWRYLYSRADAESYAASHRTVSHD